MQEPLLDAKQVSAILGVPRSAVWALARSGELPSVRLSPRAIRFHPNDVKALVDRRTAPRGSE